MSGGFDFDEVLKISLYFVLLYLAGLLAKVFKISPIIGEMAVGVILGPEAMNIVPYENFFRLAGTFGVTLMIFESGKSSLMTTQRYEMGGTHATCACISLTARTSLASQGYTSTST